MKQTKWYKNQWWVTKANQEDIWIQTPQIVIYLIYMLFWIYIANTSKFNFLDNIHIHVSSDFFSPSLNWMTSHILWLSASCFVDHLLLLSDSRKLVAYTLYSIFSWSVCVCFTSIFPPQLNFPVSKLKLPFGPLTRFLFHP